MAMTKGGERYRFLADPFLIMLGALSLALTVRHILRRSGVIHDSSRLETRMVVPSTDNFQKVKGR